MEPRASLNSFHDHHRHWGFETSFSMANLYNKYQSGLLVLMLL